MRPEPSRLFAGTTTLRIDSKGLNHILVPIIPNHQESQNNWPIG
jgi:hypothetical protein